MNHRIALLSVLGLHYAIAGVHAASHYSIPVGLGPVLDVVVGLVVFVAPAAGAVLALRGHPAGIPMFAVSMAGAALIGGVLHFVVPSPDHVGAVPHGPWQLPFRASAAGLAIVEAGGTALGGWYWYARSASSSRQAYASNSSPNSGK